MENLKASDNTYDWLGNGMYFWENSYQRAYDWASNNPKYHKPAVLGAVIDLGFCLNLTDYHSTDVLKHNVREYDSVRGVFVEGKEIYPGAAVKEKTHIQLCVVNPNCIKGFFAPREAA